MVETLLEQGLPAGEAERQVIGIIEGETQAEAAAREEAEAAAERRRAYEEQQRFIRTSPMRLPGMGAKVVSGKRAEG